MRRSRGLLKVALPTAAALGAGAAVAVGAIPGGADGKTITGCYANINGVYVNDIQEPYGALRVIDPSQRGEPNAVSDEYECQRDETQITWNQEGPTGPQGPVGPQGSAGGQGAAGSAGSPGSPLIGGTSFGLTNNSGQTFLKLDGIAGESTDKQHKGEINIESFSLGAQGAIGSAGTGAGAGKTSIQSFTITKSLDKSSPALMQDAAAGTHIDSAELSFAHKSAGKEQTYLKYDFSNIVISSISDGQSPGGAPSEQVTFAFQKLQETLVGQNGKSIASIGWNVATNQKL
ncbi:MAG TPA: type VI secretion system tube protein Hcp [Solirubrobacteraceae bacterium]|jgi:type VI secretion system secreted protein Hcp